MPRDSGKTMRIKKRKTLVHNAFADKLPYVTIRTSPTSSNGCIGCRLIDVEQKTVTSTEAKATLNALLANLTRTGAVVITSHGEPVAVLSPFVDAPRRFGQLPTLTVPDDFDAPLPDAELTAWEQDS